MGHLVTAGAVWVCVGSGFCAAAVIAGVAAVGTGYVIYDLVFDGGAARIGTAFTRFDTAEDAFTVGATVAGVGALAYRPLTNVAARRFGSLAAGEPAEMNTWLESGATVRHSPTATAIGDDWATLENFGRSQGAAGHDVIVHGGYDAAGEVRFYVNGNFTDSQQIADAILANPHYVPGTRINLVTCYGACDLHRNSRRHSEA